MNQHLIHTIHSTRDNFVYVHIQNLCLEPHIYAFTFKIFNHSSITHFEIKQLVSPSIEQHTTHEFTHYKQFKPNLPSINASSVTN